MNMKLWLDLTNSPHINFFKPFVNKWRDEGKSVVITARDLSNTIDLIKSNGWNFEVIGSHAGKSIVRKLLHFPKRVARLYLFLRKVRPDIGISHSSFYSPLVCRLLGIPSIYINDNEHAKGNYLAMVFSRITLIPEFLHNNLGTIKFWKYFRIGSYPGVKEGVYLSQGSDLFSNCNKEKKDTFCFVRPEPWNAEYYSSSNTDIKQFIQSLSNNFKVIVLPRDKIQAEMFRKFFDNKIMIENKPLDINEIVNACSLFIGAGGSMTREMALLGVPTVSIYQGDLLEVDKYLINEGYMDHNKDLSINQIKKYMKNRDSIDSKALIYKGSEAFHLIDSMVTKLCKK